MSRIRLLITIASAFLLSNCVTTQGVVDPITPEEQALYTVGNVNVLYNPTMSEKIQDLDQQALNENGEGNVKSHPLNKALKSEIKTELISRGINGKKRANILVELDTLKFSNAAMVMLTGDSDQLSGNVIVTDSNTKATIGEFYVDVIEARGGLIGLAMRGGNVRERLIAKFSEKVGDNFGLQNLEKDAIQAQMNRKADKGNE